MTPALPEMDEVRMDAMSLPGRLVPDAAAPPGESFARVSVGTLLEYGYPDLGVAANGGAAIDDGLWLGATAIAGTTPGGTIGALAATFSGSWSVGRRVRVGGFLAGGVGDFAAERVAMASAGFTLDAGSDRVRFDLAIAPLTILLVFDSVQPLPLAASELGVRVRVGPNGAMRFGMESALPSVSYRHVVGRFFFDAGASGLIVINEIRATAGRVW